MFSRITRLPLRRCIHTASQTQTAPRRLPRLGFALGASTVLASYLALHFTLDNHRVALDGPTPSKSPQNAPLRYPTFTEPHHVPMPEPNPLQDAKEDLTSTPPASSSPSTESSNSPPGSDPAVVVTDAAADEETTDGAGQSAYNPVTGEINWDCPCLGGMAHGPCGQQFREAFSCFVFSEDEPKGINCVDKFKAMQNCFREHPEVYAEEIMDDEEEESEAPATSTAAVVQESASDSTLSENAAPASDPAPSAVTAASS